MFKITSQLLTRLSRFLVLPVLLFMAGCQYMQSDKVPAAERVAQPGAEYDYTIAPGDRLNIFVWRNPELTVQGVPVKPDGRISSPLVEDLMAAGKTTTQLSLDIRKELSEVVQNPHVTVTVTDFRAGYHQQVRVVGEAAIPSAIPYQADMTLLDVMIAVGGLTEFAAGNRASIVRDVDGEKKQFRVRLQDLLRGGDMSANVQVYPGDIVIIPESFF